MKVLITGANGFIGKNLRCRLAERQDVQVVCFSRQTGIAQLSSCLQGVDVVFHLAGVNRPEDPAEFVTGNADLTAELARLVREVVRDTGRAITVVTTSSIHAAGDSPYGSSKRAAEVAMRRAGREAGFPVHIFRLPNVFGKWCRPNYNSAVATFCHNVTRSLPIRVNDPDARVTLVYIDDVVERFLELMDGAEAKTDEEGFSILTPQYSTTVGELARLISSFKESRSTLLTERVGTGLVRALYATYVSYLPVEAFSYRVAEHRDARGVFVEMLKTPDCGQFSFFTASPGVTRGGHYHHTKTEKFLVLKGEARFRFRHMQSGETHELLTSGARAEIVETVPGWTHDITNLGVDDLIVMLWANEIFDRSHPDTYACPV